MPLNTASGHIEAPLVTLDNINVKGASVCDVEVVVHDLPEEARVDGLLGLNFLKKFQVNIDFRKGIISLFSPIKP